MTENEEIRDESIIDEEKLINSLEWQDIKTFREEYLSFTRMIEQFFTRK